MYGGEGVQLVTMLRTRVLFLYLHTLASFFYSTRFYSGFIVTFIPTLLDSLTFIKHQHYISFIHSPQTLHAHSATIRQHQQLQLQQDVSSPTVSINSINGTAPPFPRSLLILPHALLQSRADNAWTNSLSHKPVTCRVRTGQSAF